MLNPHYRTMGNLYGSEYWTYTLPRRVGADRALEITDRLPADGYRRGMRDRPDRRCFRCRRRRFPAPARVTRCGSRGRSGLAEPAQRQAAAPTRTSAPAPWPAIARMSWRTWPTTSLDPTQLPRGAQSFCPWGADFRREPTSPRPVRVDSRCLGTGVMTCSTFSRARSFDVSRRSPPAANWAESGPSFGSGHCAGGLRSVLADLVSKSCWSSDAPRIGRSFRCWSESAGCDRQPGRERGCGGHPHQPLGCSSRA